MTTPGLALPAIAFIVWHVKGGFPEFAQVAAAADKTKLLDFSFDLTKATVWGFVFLVIFDVVLTFPKDQVLMQRVLSTESDKEAGRSVWAFAAIMIPGGFIFYGIGTALYVYYQSHPERMNPLLPVDATFPLFIAAELPMGVTGLIIAGIFAAAMATLSVSGSVIAGEWILSDGPIFSPCRSLSAMPDRSRLAPVLVPRKSGA